jgi:DNA polymerase-3 subunit epsilon
MPRAKPHSREHLLDYALAEATPAGTNTLTAALPVGDYRFIALDVETSCGDSASICQIGLACVDAHNAIRTWSAYINPLMPFAPFNTELHGISAETVRSAPTFAQIWPDLLSLLIQQPLVQHSRFDERAINAACKTHELTSPRLVWHDSVSIARNAWPELKSNGGHGLASLKRHLNLDFQHHDAGEDARAAAMVVIQAEGVAPRTAVNDALRAKPFQLSWLF